MPGESPLSMMHSLERRAGKPAMRRVRRRWWPILAPIAIVIVLALVWVWLWYYASSIADRTLAGWVEREAAAGRIYSCGSQSIGGFPFRIEANCVDAAAADRNQTAAVRRQGEAHQLCGGGLAPDSAGRRNQRPRDSGNSRPTAELDRGLEACAANGTWAATRSRRRLNPAGRIACRPHRG